MALRDILSQNKTNSDVVRAKPTTKDNHYYEIKQKLHTQLVEEANLSMLDQMDEADIRSEIAQILEHYLQQEKVFVNEQERKDLVVEIVDELVGFGPLEPF